MQPSSRPALHRKSVTSKLESPNPPPDTQLRLLRRPPAPSVVEPSSFLQKSPEQEVSTARVMELDGFLLAALRNPKDRMFLLKLDKDMERFINDQSRVRLEFPQMNSYQRLIVHRAAQYFKLSHVVDNSKKAIVLYKAPDTEIPALRFHDLLEQEEEPVQTTQSLRIMRRNPAASANHPQSVAPAPSSQNSQSVKSNSSDSGESTEAHTMQDRRSMTIEEREAAYQKARARIFQDLIVEQQQQPQSQQQGSSPLVAATGSTSAVSISAPTKGISINDSSSTDTLLSGNGNSGSIGKGKMKLAPKDSPILSSQSSGVSSKSITRKPSEPVVSPQQRSQKSNSSNVSLATTSTSLGPQNLSPQSNDFPKLSATTSATVPWNSSPFLPHSQSQQLPILPHQHQQQMCWNASAYASLPGNMMFNPSGAFDLSNMRYNLPPTEMSYAAWTQTPPPPPPPPPPHQQQQQQQQQQQTSVNVPNHPLHSVSSMPVFPPNALNPDNGMWSMQRSNSAPVAQELVAKECGESSVASRDTTRPSSRGSSTAEYLENKPTPPSSAPATATTTTSNNNNNTNATNQIPWNGFTSKQPLTYDAMALLNYQMQAAVYARMPYSTVMPQGDCYTAPTMMPMNYPPYRMYPTQYPTVPSPQIYPFRSDQRPVGRTGELFDPNAATTPTSPPATVSTASTSKKSASVRSTSEKPSKPQVKSTRRVSSNSNGLLFDYAAQQPYEGVKPTSKPPRPTHILEVVALDKNDNLDNVGLNQATMKRIINSTTQEATLLAVFRTSQQATEALERVVSDRFRLLEWRPVVIMPNTSASLALNDENAGEM